MADAELTCAELVELVNDYVEDTLPAGERARLDEHLEVCTGCRNYVDQIRTTVRLTGRLRVADLSAAARADLVAAFRGYHTNSPG
jgi:anti-sigma factor RsiW